MAGELLPYFKLFPAETLADERFAGWTLEERGAWLSLLLHAWVNGSIPADEASIARILHVDAVAMRSLWVGIADRFIPHPDALGRLTSRRLELEREDATAKSRAGVKAAKSRWKKTHATAMRPQCDRNAVAMPTEQSRAEQSTSTETPALLAPLPVVAVLPCVGKGPKTYGVTTAQVDGWAKDFPGVDVPAEVRKARAWLEANPRKRKTATGIPAFLVGWFSRQQNDPRNRRPEDPYDAAMRKLRDDAEAEVAGAGLGSRGHARPDPAPQAAQRSLPEAPAAVSAAVRNLLGGGWATGEFQDGPALEPRGERGPVAAKGPVRDA
jgi:uncharacterized protein YdaU (DUF1376 family)